MTDEPNVGADDTDTHTDTDTDTEEAIAPAAGAPARRPSPSAQAATRARRIGGGPTPGPRPGPARPAPDTQTGAEPAPSARRGGLRAARAAATERSATAVRPATSLTKPPSPKPTKASPSSTADAATARRRTERIQWVPAGVLGLAVVVLAVLCYTFGNGVWHGGKSAGDVRTQVLAAAKTCTAKVSSYDYRKLAQSKKDGQSCSTGQFKKDYTTAMDTIIAKEAPTTQTTQSVAVAKAGIEQVSSDGKQWTLLIYGQHTVTNKTTGLKTPRLDKLSVRVTMDKVGPKWLISKLDLVDG